ncbi:MAG: hypothetical protein R3E39_28340 [Anaerolineae bacterium]
MTNRIIGRETKLNQLNAWKQSADPLIVIGGMGKSALNWELATGH